MIVIIDVESKNWVIDKYHPQENAMLRRHFGKLWKKVTSKCDEHQLISIYSSEKPRERLCALYSPLGSIINEKGYLGEVKDLLNSIREAEVTFRLCGTTEDDRAVATEIGEKLRAYCEAQQGN